MFFILGTDGKEYGPVSVAKIQEWMNAGRANLETKARRADATEWHTLGAFPEFGGASVPPPLTPHSLPAMTAAVSTVPELPLAHLGLRFGAALIDGILLTACKTPIIIAVARVFRDALQDPNMQLNPELVNRAMMSSLVQALPLLGAYAVVQMILLCLRSQSVGKLLLGLRIVSVETNEPGGPVRAFLIRGLAVWVIEQIPLIGLFFWIVDVCFIFRADRRCVHDLLAGTKVVKL